MHKPRDYQLAAIDAVLDYWATEGGSPLIEMATGTGKSLVMAELCRRLVREYDGFRILVITHVKELIEQNFSELANIWPGAPSGIHSAGLGQRATHQQIIFGGIQTAHRNASAFGSIDLLLIDEAHLVPRKASTMYGKFIAQLRAINPDMRVAGLTATPYRLGSGRLDHGDDAMFDKIVYRYGLAEGVRDGYLARLVGKWVETGFDLTGVGKSGGEYIENQLQAAVDKDEITKRAVAEIVAYGRDRSSWLLFGSGVKHAYNIRDEIRRHGFSCETVVGDTPSDERKHHLDGFKSGKIRALSGNTVFATGFNATSVDLIGDLQPSLSVSRYVQKAGRGTRLHPGKDNCLYLDFAKNIDTHGPVDMVKPPGEKKGGGVAPIKICPGCHSIILAGLRECPDCNHVFISQPVSKLTVKASALAPMGSAPAEWVGVKARNFTLHHKPDKPVGIVARFQCGFVVHKAYYGPGRPGGVLRSKGDKFWLAHGGQMPLPRTADDWIARQGELATTEQISVEPDGKYINVVDARPTSLAVAAE